MTTGFGVGITSGSTSTVGVAGAGAVTAARGLTGVTWISPRAKAPEDRVGRGVMGSGEPGGAELVASAVGGWTAGATIGAGLALAGAGVTGVVRVASVAAAAEGLAASVPAAVGGEEMCGAAAVAVSGDGKGAVTVTGGGVFMGSTPTFGLTAAAATRPECCFWVTVLDLRSLPGPCPWP